jgi:hypothetical protein
MIGRFEEGKKQLSTPLFPIPFSSLNKMFGHRARELLAGHKIVSEYAERIYAYMKKTKRYKKRRTSR